MVLLFAGTTLAATVYVSPDGGNIPPYTSWDTAAHSIQDAIDAASGGDTVLISNGVYVLTTAINVNKAVTLTSLNGFKTVLIDGNGVTLCIDLNAAGAVVDAVTVTNGNGSTGGGIYMLNGTTVRNSKITNCESTSGGGIYMDGGGLVENCKLCQNITSGSGAGVYIENDGLVTNSVIKHNFAKTHGGGAYFKAGGVIVRSLLHGNVTTNDGGAANFNNGGLMQYCTIYKNVGDKGAALNIFKGTVRNCLVYNNIGGLAGAAYLKSGALIQSSTIVSNRAINGTGGLFFSGGGVVENTILYYNNGSNWDADGGGANMTYSCTTPDPGGVGNTTNLPQFVNRSIDDYHLRETSPLIDAGLNQAWMTGAKDLDGAPRIWNSIVDIGVYELAAPGFLDITTTPFWVTYDVKEAQVAGTNNANIIGSLCVSNAASHSAATFPAISPWVTPLVSLAVGANPIYVKGTNEFGVVSFDMVVITRGGIGTGTPFVDVTTTPTFVTYDVTEIAVAGTNNLHVVGEMSVSNAANGLSHSIPATASWTTLPVTLAVGANEIIVTGSNLLNEVVSDSVIITRGGIGTGEPYVDVTTTPHFVTYDVTDSPVAGTNNIHVMGTMTASNAANGTTATFPAAASWTTPSLPLAVGANEIIVTGTNLLNKVATDSVVITRGGVGTGEPYVDVTTTPYFVTYDVTDVLVAGTNNIHVMGTMTVSNAANGQVGTFAAAAGWLTPPVTLAVGANEIIVTGTNLLNKSASDSVVITRGGIGTGQPFVDVTTTPHFVTYDITSLPVAGTNNIHVMGTMVVSNMANGTTATFPAAASWTTPSLPLAVGDNEFVVIGTNLLNKVAMDSVIIRRGGVGTGEPYVDVTTTPHFVTYDITSSPVAGTNNIHVMGTMTVSNAANGAVATFPAASSWTTPALPLAVGDNEFIVTGTNLLNKVATDSVIIKRGGVGTGEPYVDVTTTPHFVTYDITSSPVAGTNNIHVMGTMTVSNAANGAVATFPAAASWTTPALPLAVGDNEFIVTGTNLLNKVATDSVIIKRGGVGTGEPYVDVTTTPHFVTYDITSSPVAGTNNIHVMGTMTVSNAANGAVATFPAAASWTTPALPLAVGDNEFIVTGTNLLNKVATDSVIIKRGGVGTGEPYVDVTTTPHFVTYDITSSPVAGTNNIHVMGTMTVSNAANGVVATFPAAASWTTPALPLAVGDNEFIVTGTNLLNKVATDSVIIKRGGVGTGEPYVDVTTTPHFVTYDITSSPVAGTNNIHVMGTMTVSNAANGVVATFPAAASWTTPALPLAVGDNEFIVTGTNLLNKVATDSVIIKRGGVGTGEPYVDVTTTPHFVTYDITSSPVAGTNNIHVMGTMTVSNAANGAVATFPAAASWTTPALPLAVGDNEFIVTGTNLLNKVATDSVIIKRGGVGTGEPFVDVTNTPYFVTYDVLEVPVAGTNNIHVMGTMTASNVANGTVVTFPATASWTTPAITLAVGANEIIVTGTNLLNRVATDSVVITRGGVGTGEPYVDVTTTPHFVTYDITSSPVAGTNNIHVMGTMTVSNAANGAVATFPATASWTTPALPLAVGANEIIVTGTNLLNKVATDSVIITRGGVGTGEPFVDVTNTPYFVTYDVLEVPVAGTNNIHVMGTMTASNAANGAVATFPATASWTTPNLPLAVGANEIIVIGTNLLNRVATDSVVITRGGVGTGEPFVDVTNTPYFVTYDVTEVPVAGTNNIHVMGTMTASNTANGAVVTFPATASWTTPAVALAVGDNEIIVTGTNLLNRSSSDSVIITRGGVGTGEPFVDVTNTPFFVTMDITEENVSGTNNIHVMGTMTVSNAANGAVATFPASASWTTPNLPLEVGDNEFIVTGTNLLNRVATDSVIVNRGGPGTGKPFVDVTTEPETVVFAVQQFSVEGTNNIHVVGTMIVSNMANDEAATFTAQTPWTAPALPLIVGANTFIVTGTNMFGETSSDSVVITRLVPPAEVTITRPNNGEFYRFNRGDHVTNFYGITGGVVTQLTWQNSLTMQSGELPITEEFMFPALLEVGTNIITVFAYGPGGSGSDRMVIDIGPYNGIPSNGVFCLWPTLIGEDQTGTVEFVSTRDAEYTLFVTTAQGTQEVAKGECGEGWNLVPFYSGDLPLQLNQGSNKVFAAVGNEKPLYAGEVMVVPDLAANNLWEEDLDGDLVRVTYKSKVGGQLTVKGRTLYISNGDAKDKLIIKAKPQKNSSTANKSTDIAGIISDSGFTVVKVMGNVDRLQTDGITRKIILKNGSLGHACRTRLHNVRFNSTLGKTLVKVIVGNIHANILSGTVEYDPGFNGILSTNGTIPVTIKTREGVKVMMVKGGQLGVDGIRRWTDAAFVKKAMAKAKKKIGGGIIDYSFLMTGEYKPGKLSSMVAYIANDVFDSSGTNGNAFVVCGHDPSLAGNQKVNWAEQPVQYNVKKVLSKGTTLEGTFVLKTQPKKVKAKGTNNATFIIDGVKQ
jgi:hypothetical protein